MTGTPSLTTSALHPEAGDAATGDGTTRRCIATGVLDDPSRLVRFVVGPEDTIWPDVRAELPGRGMWVSAARAALEQAIARKAFNRAAKRPVVVPADLVERTELLIAERCRNWLGLAQSAGLVVSGYEKVRARLQAGKVAALVQARDGSPDQRRKVAASAPGIKLVESLDSAELGLALGRQNVIHAALSSGRLADRFLVEALRLAGFRTP